MSDIRFNQWLHQSGTGGVSQVASGAVGVGTTNPLADFYVRGDAQITGILTAGHIAMGSSIPATSGKRNPISLARSLARAINSIETTTQKARTR